MKWVAEVKDRPAIADIPTKANKQHYEVNNNVACD